MQMQMGSNKIHGSFISQNRKFFSKVSFSWATIRAPVTSEKPLNYELLNIIYIPGLT